MLEANVVLVRDNLVEDVDDEDASVRNDDALVENDKVIVLDRECGTLNSRLAWPEWNSSGELGYLPAPKLWRHWGKVSRAWSPVYG